jgi:hypothetical protein
MLASNLDIDSYFFLELLNGQKVIHNDIIKPAESRNGKPQVLYEDSWVAIIIAGLSVQVWLGILFLSQGGGNGKKSFLLHNTICFLNTHGNSNASSR